MTDKTIIFILKVKVQWYNYSLDLASETSWICGCRFGRLN